MQRALTCMWSPAKTIRVPLVANARGIMVSHSMAWAASSNRMCVKNPTKYTVKTVKHIKAATEAREVLFGVFFFSLFISAKERVYCANLRVVNPQFRKSSI